MVFSFIISVFIYRELKLKDMLACSSTRSGAPRWSCSSAGRRLAAAYYITTAQIPVLLGNTLLGLAGDNVYMFMFLVNILVLLVGCVMDLTPALLILGPMLMPLATGYGLDPVYFGVVLIVNLCIGLITPPVGNILYVACGISKFSVAEISKAIWPNIVIGVIVLFIITYLPWTITWLPNLLIK